MYSRSSSPSAVCCCLLGGWGSHLQNNSGNFHQILLSGYLRGELKQRIQGGGWGRGGFVCGRPHKVVFTYTSSLWPGSLLIATKTFLEQGSLLAFDGQGWAGSWILRKV